MSNKQQSHDELSDLHIYVCQGRYIKSVQAMGYLRRVLLKEKIPNKCWINFNIGVHTM